MDKRVLWSSARSRHAVRGLLSVLVVFLATDSAGAATPAPQFGFYTVTPCRVVDTRNPTGPYGGPALLANSDRTFVVAGRCGIPSTADAVSLNITVTQATSSGDLRIYPGAGSSSMSSSINYRTVRTRANNGVYGIGVTGDLGVRCNQPSGSVHLILDVSGYFDISSGGGGSGSGSLWSKWYGGSGTDTGKSVAVDSSGNVVVAGQYQGIVNFGAGAVTSYTNPVSGPTADVFVAKYSSSGSPVWSRGIGGDGVDSAYAVAADSSSGATVVTGFQGSTSVDYGAGMLGNRGGSDIFVAKYNSAGGYVWAKTIGGTGGDSGTGVAVDTGANVFVTGQFSVSASGVDFGGGPLSSAGSTDVFLVKYSSAGAHVWSKRFGSSGGDLSGPVAVDGSGNVIVAGTFTGSINLGGSALTSAGLRDLFVAKFSATGQHLWSKRFGGTSDDWVRGIAVDGAGDVVLTGQFLNTINFGGSNLTSAGAEDIFLAKLSGANGGHLWSKRLGGSEATDAGYGVAVDGAGNVALTGYFAGGVDFGGGTILAQMYDIFVAKYSSSGAFIWAKRYGDPAGLYNSQFGDAIAMSTTGNVFIAGHFAGTLDLGAGGSMTSDPYGGTDGFLASVGP